MIYDRQSIKIFHFIGKIISKNNEKCFITNGIYYTAFNYFISSPKPNSSFR
jgi:hypothetical protein